MWDLPPDFINKYINQLRNMGYDIQMKARLGNNGLDAGVCCENGVGGICLSYEFKRFSPLNINSKTSIGYKAVMEDFNNQDDDVQAYIIENSAKCTGCKQCTKGKEVPIYAQKLNYQGKVYIKCPLYPSNCWTSVDKTRIERLIKIVDLQKQYSQK